MVAMPRFSVVIKLWITNKNEAHLAFAFVALPHRKSNPGRFEFVIASGRTPRNPALWHGSVTTSALAFFKLKRKSAALVVNRIHFLRL